MSLIKVMSPELANMIAAGEVIERPSSVIKELVENSIDAQAQNIDVHLFNSGKSLIVVKDDGSGMDEEDAILAFKRHASSKLKSVYDLPRISTLGFRGEAVPSIASISKVKMVTSDGKSGTKVLAEPEKELEVTPCSLSKGTTFEVSELFYNTPARLKYLKSERTEVQSCIEVMQHLALGFPSISFKLTIDNKEVLKTNGRGNLLETISLIYGNDVAKNAIPLHFEGDGYQGDGFIVHPSFSYSTRYNMLTFLNNRSVYIPKVQKAIVDAYKDYLPPQRYPLTFISFTIDYSLVDVNVHPSKREVRLSCEEALARSCNLACLQSLSKTRGDFAKVEIPQVQITSLSSNSSSLDEKSFAHQDFVQAPEEIKEKSEEKPKEFNNLFDAFDNEELTLNFNDNNGLIKTEEEKTVPLIVSNAKFPKLYPLGQILETYIVCDGEDGLYLIDQHAAAERINFEKCQEEFNAKLDLVMPLFPIVVDLTPALKQNYDQNHVQMLTDIGFVTSEFGNSSIKIDEIPSSFQPKDDEGLIRDIVVQVLSDRKINLTEVKRLAIATKACKMSIKANHLLTRDLQVRLIENLSKCNNPLNCPHGRPTVIKISKYDIEKLFKRTGF